MLVNFNEMLKQAKENNYAVPHFNINNLEWTKFILEECEKLQIPVILGVTNTTAKYFGGWSVCYSVVTSLIKDLNITIPVCLHLDHGTEEDCYCAINTGFTSVMIDASMYNLDKNIGITKRVVECAHKKGISVEAEIGEIKGNSNSITLDDCKKFCLETKIDALAPGIGNIHGIYKEKPHLNFELLKEISTNIDIPLVLHGGSGIPQEDIKKCIQNGITKININTDLQVVWRKEVEKYIINNKEIYDPRKIISSAKDQFNGKIEELINLFETKKVTK